MGNYYGFDIQTVMASPGPIGKTTPDRGIFKPLECKGPTAITTFDGTASRTGSNLTFTSAADAVKAGYDANNPVLGTTVVLSGKPMVTLSWSSSTVAVVDVSGDIAGATPTSVQAPNAFGINSGGTLGWAVLANGTLYFAGNVGVMTTGPGTPLHVLKTDAVNSNDMLLKIGRAHV